MFTGITRGIFEVDRLVRGPESLDFWIRLPGLTDGLEVGASVAVDGVCHTVVEIEGERVRFQSIAETLRRTTLKFLKPGARVSVERSFRVGDEVGGHEVSGHVIGTGTIVARRWQDTELGLCVRVPASWMKYIQRKGFIAVDGSSLTVGEVELEADSQVAELGSPSSAQHAGSTTGETSPPNLADGAPEFGRFWLHLVPETLRLTKFADKRIGDEVNIELDARTVALVDTVERWLNERLPSLLERHLERWSRDPSLLAGGKR